MPAAAAIIAGQPGPAGSVWAGRGASVQLRLAMPEAEAGIGSQRQVGGAQPTLTLLPEDDTAQRPTKEDR